MEIICNPGVKGDFKVLLIILCVCNSGVKEIFRSEYEYEYENDTFI